MSTSIPPIGTWISPRARLPQPCSKPAVKSCRKSVKSTHPLSLEQLLIPQQETSSASIFSMWLCLTTKQVHLRGYVYSSFTDICGILSDICVKKMTGTILTLAHVTHMLYFNQPTHSHLSRHTAKACTLYL